MFSFLVYGPGSGQPLSHPGAQGLGASLSAQTSGLRRREGKRGIFPYKKKGSLILTKKLSGGSSIGLLA